MQTHRSELEQVGVHRDVVEDLDAVRHDPRDEEQPPLLEKIVASFILIPKSHFNLSASAKICQSKRPFFLYSVSLVVANLGWVNLNFHVPLSA